MMNLIEMRTIVRRDLHDEAAVNYRWTDNEIDRHIDHAVKDFSEAIPDELRLVKPTIADSRSLDISDITDRVMVEAVEYPVEQFPPHFQRFTIWGNMLTILGDEVPDGSDTYIYYGRLHTLDALGSTIPLRYNDLVATGAAGYAAVQWASYAINQVNAGGVQTPAEYLAWGKDRLEQFYTRLKVMGRKNKVRVRSLYRPYRVAASSTTDYGP
jgi:hypothetical protein